MGALEKVQTGEILFNDKNIKKIGFTKYRKKFVNIIFQSYNLIPYLNAVQNVILAIDINKHKVGNKKKFAKELLEKGGLDEEKQKRNVLKLSGGEQQRVAIARAMAGNKPVILADEPTGNLDTETESKVIKLFKQLADDGKIVICVTHSKSVSKISDVIYEIKNGVIQ